MASISTPSVRRQQKRVKPLLWKELTSIPFFCLCIWMSAGLFFMNFYIGNVADQMFQKAGGIRVNAHAYTGWFTTILPLGAAAIPFYGYASDRYGLPFSVVLSTVFGLVFSVSCWYHSLQLQIATFIFYSLFRTFVFATFFSLVAKEFGYSSFGIISGLILFIAGAVCLLQYPVREYAVPDENFDFINFVQMIVVIASGIGFSIYINIHLKDSTPAAVKRRKLAEKENREGGSGGGYGSTGDFKRPLQKVKEQS
eukprot:CAMPEP_0114489446 /NCGR_PEP_ID=MMETSP0109-20121206/1896_1 /TAXON_ID=29199 /ORGANISM="Chlorarachnion reptans, Strain CCCM449" /LENGTH=253 /DNA_ID=CAMNT_0001665963 /DNA_START=123 /DNA_END=884 /DNA_ORIENTATION=+